jgi:hypothetical protein
MFGSLPSTASSLRRALPRLFALVLIGAAFVHLSVPIGRTFGAVAAPVLFNIGLTFHAFAASEAVLRILLHKVDAQKIALSAVNTGNLAQALVFGFHCLLRLAAFILLAGATAGSGGAHAAQPPAAALAYLPILKEQQRAYWPDLQQASVLGAQIHRETGPCPGRHCWSAHAQLRTSREQGIGFGQLTRTWSKSGVLRFDALTDLVRAHPQELAGLSWANPYDPALQLRALVLMDHDIYRRIDGAASDADRWAFTLAAYNGGPGAVRSDRVMCEASDGCDPSLWFGNVERTSIKARQAVQGYGQSFFEVNRSYVREILLSLRPRYLTLDA